MKEKAGIALLLIGLMAYVLYGIVAAPPSVHETTPKASASPTYQIIRDEKQLGIKRVLEIRLEHRLSETALKELALKLKATDSDYPRIFIAYYLPGMEAGRGAWAVTNFVPNLNLHIMGLSAEREDALRKQADDPSKVILGRWNDEILQCRVTFFRKNGKVFMERFFNDGSSGVDELLEKNNGKFETKEKHDEYIYYKISSNDTLEIWNNNGLIGTAQKAS